MTSHATPGDLCTDDCTHVCPACENGYPEACDDLVVLPGGGPGGGPVVACQADQEPVGPIDWDDVEHWGGRVHVATTDDLGHGRHSEGTSDQ